MQITRETVQLETPFRFISDTCQGCGEKHGYDLFMFDAGISVEGILKNDSDAEKSFVLVRQIADIINMPVDEYKKLSDNAKAELEEHYDNLEEELEELGLQFSQPQFHLLVFYDFGLPISNNVNDANSVEKARQLFGMERNVMPKENSRNTGSKTTSDKNTNKETNVTPTPNRCRTDAEQNENNAEQTTTNSNNPNNLDTNGEAYIKLILIEEYNEFIRSAPMFQGTCRNVGDIKKVYDMCVGGLNPKLISKKDTAFDSGEDGFGFLGHNSASLN